MDGCLCGDEVFAAGVGSAGPLTARNPCFNATGFAWIGLVSTLDEHRDYLEPHDSVAV
jgi:hypothetical protein